MKTSFITTVFNEKKNIEKFIESILEQTQRPGEIIIVDGGSTDGTYELLVELSKKNRLLKVYQVGRVNIARGRNIAIDKAKGDIILASDAGCVLDKNWIKDTLKYFPNENVVAGSSKAIIKNNFDFFQSLLTLRKVDRPSRMSSRNVAFKKKCWEEVGGYPERSLTGEDNRFMINLMDKGYKIEINPKKLVSWDMRPTLSKFAKQYYLYGRGDRIQGNLTKRTLKKNLWMIVSFWLYLVFLMILLVFSRVSALALVFAPWIFLELYAFKIMIKTKKISGLFWVPVLLITKRIFYILGATFK